MSTVNTINVTLVKSTIGRVESHKATVKGLGLRRMHHTVTVQDTPAIRGMINTVSYLLKVSEGEPVSVSAKPKKQATPTAPVSVKTVNKDIPKKYLDKAGQEDISVIEGIGPKTVEILKAAGYDSFGKIAAKTVEELQEIVKSGGGRVTASISTWPEQAILLANGEFEKFETLAAELDGGVRK